MIHIENLVKRYGDLVALNHLNLDIKEGVVISLKSENTIPLKNMVVYGISREDADTFAAASQARYEAARQAGFFADEIVEVSVPTGRKTPPRLVTTDEHPRPESDFAALSRLRPLFEGGVAYFRPSRA